jgi:hypothetical protein
MTRTCRGAVLSALLAGCAGMTETDCRSANWYELGERDALIYGLRPQIDQYGYLCRRYGLQPAEKDYLVGWFYGNHERGLRMSGSEPR